MDCRLHSLSIGSNLKQLPSEDAKRVRCLPWPSEGDEVDHIWYSVLGFDHDIASGLLPTCHFQAIICCNAMSESGRGSEASSLAHVAFILRRAREKQTRRNVEEDAPEVELHKPDTLPPV